MAPNSPTVGPWRVPIAQAVRETALPHLAAFTALLPTARAPAAPGGTRPAARRRAASADRQEKKPGGQAFHMRTPLVMVPTIPYGINGPANRTQENKGVPDTTALPTSDSPKGDAKRLEVGKALCAD